MGGLPSPVEAEGIWTAIWHQEAHHSTAIEGNTLVMKQVERLLAEGFAVGNKELKEYMEVQGYADAAHWVYGQALEPGAWTDGHLLTLTEVRDTSMRWLSAPSGGWPRMRMQPTRGTRKLPRTRHRALPWGHGPTLVGRGARRPCRMAR